MGAFSGKLPNKPAPAQQRAGTAPTATPKTSPAHMHAAHAAWNPRLWPAPRQNGSALTRRLESSGNGAFLRWADNLYCSGAMEQTCRLADGRSVLKGLCYWHKSSMGRLVPLTEAEMEYPAKRPTWPSQRWDPLQPHWPKSSESGFRYFGREAAHACLRGKRIMVAGDSTTRDTFYELVTVAGHGGRIMKNLPNESRAYWPDGAYAPREPGGTTQDKEGWCMGNHEKRMSCLRDIHVPGEAGRGATRFSYQFLTQSNSTWELGLSGRQMGDRAPDFAFVQCPQYEYFKPDAYNYSLTKEERAMPSNKMMGPAHLAGIGRSCRDFIERAVVAKGGRTKIFHLGMTPLPGWTRELGGEQVELDIFNSIHNALGLRCRKQPDGTYVHTTHPSSPITGSIDRYAIIGQRKRDAIHPFWNGQFAIVQLMLNHMCPPS